MQTRAQAIYKHKHESRRAAAAARATHAATCTRSTATRHQGGGPRSAATRHQAPGPRSAATRHQGGGPRPTATRARIAARCARYAGHGSRVGRPEPGGRHRRRPGHGIMQILHNHGRPGEIPGEKKPGARPGSCITKTAQLRAATRPRRRARPAWRRPCPGRRPGRR